jgi:hypothetical protein
MRLRGLAKLAFAYPVVSARCLRCPDIVLVGAQNADTWLVAEATG